MLQRFVDERPPRGPSRPRGSGTNVDAASLASALEKAVRGEVRFDSGSRALYATDASNYRQVPIGVVLPHTVDDVVATVRLCREHRAPILARGGGTSLCGQCCNVAVVLDFSKYMNRVLEIDPVRRVARVQPGCVLDDLRDAAKAHGLTFAPDPATHTHNTLGGMIGNNSCGPHSVMGGETVDNVIALDVLTYDGLRMTVGAVDDERPAANAGASGREAEIHRKLRDLGERYADRIRERFPPIPRRVSGYNLPALLPENGCDLARALVGSEGTCVVVLEALVRLVPDPPARSLLVLGYPDVYRAADHIPEVMRAKPIATEGIDDRLIDDMKAVHLHPDDVKLLPDGAGWLMVEFGGATKADADDQARRLMDALRDRDDAPAMKLFDDPDEERLLWRIRESGLGATAHVPDEPITWEGWEDSSVPIDRLGEYLRELRKLFERYGYACDLYGHFGQGCVHTRIDFDLETAEGIRQFRAFLHDAARLVTRLGGSISGEHGDGQSKAELLPEMFGEELVRAFGEFKAIWDPEGMMNPGKVVDPYRADENLRIGTAWNPPAYRPHFHYAADGGDFAKSLLRCVGVGECRKAGGLMCPSYKATREEKHATRGRARMLFEMARGEVVRDAWKSDEVHEALDLCLACKGCKGECPVKVDMATWKAEFMSHYYAGRPRPANHYAFGMIDRWARIASHAPRLANALVGRPPFANLAKRVLDIAPERHITPFASEPFTRWFAGRRGLQGRGDRVVLWPDTFNNYFRPETARAAFEVLVHAGVHVAVPDAHVCCGRPLYAIGMLDRAKAYLRNVLDVLADDIDAGTPVVVLEPACATALKDELVDLFPFDERAKRLAKQTVLFPDYLERREGDWRMPRVERKALLHGHCHHQAILKMDAEKRLLKTIGLDCEAPDTGCCGMAGSFGFERSKYATSMAIGERVLLPAVRAAASDTLLVADGFSCREQILQSTGRRALHVAEVIRMGLEGARE